MQLTISTWNINSVRLRIELVARFLKKATPDILCLQEIKTVADSFPRKALAELGYVHQAVHGQSGYNGVAIVSRVPFKKIWVHDFCAKGDARHIAVTLDNKVDLHNFYIPSGGDVPDAAVNDKFAHKLAFLAELEGLLSKMSAKRRAARILVGDFNVAPHENDVWSHKQLLDVVSHTPDEVAHLAAVKASHDWHDVSRDRARPEDKLYSWWSYRARDWASSNRGRRLDHIWLSPALEETVTRHEIFRTARGWPRPSDHVPVLVQLNL